MALREWQTRSRRRRLFRELAGCALESHSRGFRTRIEAAISGRHCHWAATHATGARRMPCGGRQSGAHQAEPVVAWGPDSLVIGIAVEDRRVTAQGSAVGSS